MHRLVCQSFTIIRMAILHRVTSGTLPSWLYLPIFGLRCHRFVWRSTIRWLNLRRANYAKSNNINTQQALWSAILLHGWELSVRCVGVAANVNIVRCCSWKASCFWYMSKSRDLSLLCCLYRWTERRVWLVARHIVAVHNLQLLVCWSHVCVGQCGPSGNAILRKQYWRTLGIAGRHTLMDLIWISLYNIALT